MPIQSYRDLEIYQLSFQLAVEIDRLSKKLPKHDMRCMKWEVKFGARQNLFRPI